MPVSPAASVLLSVLLPLLEASGCPTSEPCKMSCGLLCSPSEFCCLLPVSLSSYMLLWNKNPGLVAFLLRVSTLGQNTHTYPKMNCVPSFPRQSMHLPCVLLPSAYGKVTWKGLTHNAKVVAGESCDELQLYRKTFQLTATAAAAAKTRKKASWRPHGGRTAKWN